MVKKPVLLVVIVLVALLAGGALLFSRPAGQVEKLALISLDRQKQNSANFLDIVKRQESATCSFTGRSEGSDTTPPGEVTGDLFVSGPRARLDLVLVSKDGGLTRTSHLQDEEAGYLWSGTTGLKVNLEPGVSLFESEYFSTEITSLIDQSKGFSCRVWVPDPATLTVPAGVEFNFFEEKFKVLFEKMREAVGD